jgi:hypothetical protein
MGVAVEAGALWAGKSNTVAFKTTVGVSAGVLPGAANGARDSSAQPAIASAHAIRTPAAPRVKRGKRLSR